MSIKTHPNRTTYTARELQDQARRAVREEAKMRHYKRARLVAWSISVGATNTILIANGNAQDKKDDRLIQFELNIVI